jgi:hypothetical protein
MTLMSLYSWAMVMAFEIQKAEKIHPELLRMVENDMAFVGTGQDPRFAR